MIDVKLSVALEKEYPLKIYLVKLSNSDPNDTSEFNGSKEWVS